jgi:hypothetical protein
VPPASSIATLLGLGSRLNRTTYFCVCVCVCFDLLTPPCVGQPENCSKAYSDRRLRQIRLALQKKS